jgi:tetratricopeptide (TPR) repeat protein
MTICSLARAELALHHNDDAEIAFRDAIALFDKLSPRDRERAAALIQLEGLYAASQRFDEAVTVGRRALDASIALDGPSATTTANARRFLGGALLSVGRSQSDQQNYQEAEKSLREGVQLFDPPLPGWENIFATSLTILGKIYESNGRFADAETYFLRALDYRARLVQPTDPLLLKILANLAAHYDQMEKPTESGAYAQRAISAFDQAKLENSELGSALTWLGRSQRKLGLYTASETTYARAVDVIDRVSPPNDPGCVKTLRGIIAPGILGSTVMRRAKKRKNLSPARHYDQIRFRFHTAKTRNGRAYESI